MVTVSCELPLPFTDTGLKVAVVPLGNPVAVRFATPEYPFCPAMFIVYTVDTPGVIDWIAGSVVIRKSAPALTSNVAEAEWLNVPLEAVMVSG